MVRKMLMYGKDRYGNPFPPPLDVELCENISASGKREGDINMEAILESRIRSQGPLNSTTVKIPAANHSGAGAGGHFLEVPAPKILCTIYTMADAHAHRIRAMRETWAGGCDGFLAFSTESDPRLPAISIEHEGPEEYGNMWQKVRSMWKFVGMHYLDDYDWFLTGGDDLFVLPYNLKAYLASLTHKDGSDPRIREYFIGRKMKCEDWYANLGGPGYLLSQGTLRKFLTVVNDTKTCFASQHRSEEDFFIARCLARHGINVTDTRDFEGRQRFHNFPPGRVFHWKLGEEQGMEWYELFNEEWGLKVGKDCCAPDSVSFHYIREPSTARHLQALLYDCADIM